MTRIDVLIVEDNEEIASLIELELQRNVPDVAQVQRVADGEAAIDLCSELQPAVVILDHGLPGAKGDEVAGRIRECAPGSRIISFTALDPGRGWADQSFMKDAAGFRQIAEAVRDAANHNNGQPPAQP